MNKKEITIGETYNLDLGSTAPINLTVLEITDTTIICRYDLKY